MPQWWEKTLGVLARAQDEIVKVSQIGKAQINRSFLVHERSRLFVKLGDLAYQLAKEGKVKNSEIERFVDQIDRLSRRLEEMGDQMKDLTKALSLRLDADEETDAMKRELSAKKGRLRKKKQS
ncbi:MAG: hypothetical protein U1F57_08810 [bacterium]